MKNWKDNNLSAILEYPFDYDRYIEERLREIDDLEERRFAKELLVDGLLSSIRATEEKYRRLERSVYEEMKLPENRYGVVTTIINRSCYDPQNPTLYPVVKEDLQDLNLDPEEADNSLNIRIATIYLEASMAEQRTFEAIGRFTGVSCQGGKEQKIDCHVKPAKRYRDVIEILYRIFQDNNILWETIQTGYIDKFYDVYISSTALKDGPEAVRKAEIDFGGFQEKIRYDVIPLWNIKRIEFSSVNFLPPKEGGIYFEHEYSLGEEDEKDGCLIQKNEDINEICHEKERIVIKSKKDTFENWNSLHFIQCETVRSLGYDAPLLTNHKRDSFMRRLAENSRTQLMTKADLFRRIMELDIRDYIKVTGYKIRENTSDDPYIESMNWFIHDELFPLESRRILLFQFIEIQPGHYLNDCIVNYVISQMQQEIGEYRCVGEIVQSGQDELKEDDTE